MARVVRQVTMFPHLSVSRLHKEQHDFSLFYAWKANKTTELGTYRFEEHPNGPQ